MPRDRVLLVDDEPNVLDAFARQLGGDFALVTARSGQQALELLDGEEPFAVIVSDMHMPGMDGAKLLAAARERAPNSVRIMLTGAADQQTAIEAVNAGRIFRFLTKPCPSRTLRAALDAGIEQHRLLTAEQELLGRTLGGCVRLLTEMLSLVSPEAFGRSSRVRPLVRALARELELDNAWELEIAAMLSQLGCATLPVELLRRAYRGEALSAAEARAYNAHPQVAGALIEEVPRLGGAGTIVRHQHARADAGANVPFGAYVLSLALDVDALRTGGRADAEVLREVRRRGHRHDARVVRALERVLAAAPAEPRRAVPLAELAPGMVLAEDVFDTRGVLILGAGQEVTGPVLVRLRHFASGLDRARPVRVRVPVTEPDPDAVQERVRRLLALADDAAATEAEAATARKKAETLIRRHALAGTQGD